VPNGALYSTVEDLARFVSFEMGDGPVEVLNPKELFRNRQRIVTYPANRQPGFGIGFMAIRLGHTGIYGNSGDVAGYGADAYFEPRSRMGMIVLRNVFGVGFERMKVVRAAFEPPTAQRAADPAPTPVPADALKEYLGNYPFAPSFVITITASGDELYAQATNQRRVALERMSADNFAMAEVSAELSFERDGSGQIAVLVFHQNRINHRAPKLPPGQLPVQPKEIALTVEEAAEYVGHFGEAPYEFAVTQQDGQLSVQFAEYPAAKVFQSAKDEFFMKVVGVRITFERGPDGKINRLISRRNGRNDLWADKNSAAADSKL
jgi:hypothetical protein